MYQADRLWITEFVTEQQTKPIGVVAPPLDCGLNYAETSQETPYGGGGTVGVRGRNIKAGPPEKLSGGPAFWNVRGESVMMGCLSGTAIL